MDRPARSRGSLSSATTLLLVLGAVKLLAHMLTAGNYGYFRDELYFVDASKHLDFGYVDFPPLVAVIGALSRAVLGESLVAIHVLPAIAGALLVIVTGLMARELGGENYAQGLAALAALAAPIFLGIDALFTMNPFDELWWALAAYLLLRILKRERPARWLLLGFVVGLVVLTKITMFYFAGAVLAALLLTPQRRLLRSPWPWRAALLAAVMFLPYIGWQIAHGWPSAEFFRSYGGNSDPLSPLGYLLVQVMTLNFLSVPLWLAGLYFYFVSGRGRPYRALGWTFVILYAVFTIIHAKYYFLAPAYPLLFAAGAVAIEQQAPSRLRHFKQLYPRVLAAGGLVMAIVTLPVLPPPILAWVSSPARLAGALGIKVAGPLAGELPQPFADRLGWESMVQTVAGVYDGLPRRDQARACILARNYGEAGAVNLFGPRYGLPRAISGHDAYYIWGPGTCTGAVVISVGWSRRTLAGVFGRITLAARSTCRYCMSYENNLPIYVCRQPELPFKEAWPRFKLYYDEWTS